jgi:histidinol dehydrogenase
VKRTNVIALSEKTLAELAPSAAAIARFEGLPLHAESVERKPATEKVLS